MNASIKKITSVAVALMLLVMIIAPVVTDAASRWDRGFHRGFHHGGIGLGGRADLGDLLILNQLFGGGLYRPVAPVFGGLYPAPIYGGYGGANLGNLLILNQLFGGRGGIFR